ncbi:MAG: multicopper oxidase domain-containing protein [Acidimicrobiia bacterium]|nr:multicopper oxidase domain-containing protein [Acidimicrobiia bacterium]
MQTTRRDFLKMGAAAGAGLYISTKSGWMRVAGATPAAPGLSDPAFQPKFVNPVPDAMAPSFKYAPKKGRIKVAVGPTTQYTGLVDDLGNPLPTPLFGYGTPEGGYTWPGRTFELQSGEPVEVKWENKLQNPDGSFIEHLLPVDTSLHWAYSLHGYEEYDIDNSGIPIVSHLHGGHTDFQFDGNPEFFFSPGYGVRGPQWRDKTYTYKNDQPAGTLWYHDHALGITRLNVYAGLAGFYILRDEFDTGLPDNPLGLPAWPYEKAYAIQDRMFNADGSLFYPAFPGDPFYDDFITGEGAILPPDLFPGGGPTALAEFFGDHMVVNGVIWPKEDVEPRHYRMRLLNGTDSRFMVFQFRAVAPGATDLSSASAPIPFWVIGSDQGLASSATQVDTLVSEPGSRYDVVFDFSGLDVGSRIVLTNIGGDAPFGGDYGEDLDLGDFFPDRQTDRIMAFDVNQPLDPNVPDNFEPTLVGGYSGVTAPSVRTRKVALFEGMDEFGRLQPLLGTAEPATDHLGNPINWPDTPPYVNAGLVGQMEGAIAWHSQTTENPALGSTEIWEIYNATGDAHPVHLHLVHFEVLDRREFTADVVVQPIVQHNGLLGNGFRLENIEVGALVDPGEEYVENAPKDMVTALPDQVTRIKATFDKPGRYVWHCHILSHEDHEMMRVLHVGPGA